jgi:parvulin-like peptidyl-prolyl isomerase
MRSLVSITVVFMVLFTLLCGCSQKAQEQNILAEFDDQVVTLEELEKEISELPEWKQEKYSDQAGREEYLTLMAESRMLLQVADEKELDKDPEIVKQTREYKDQLMVKELVKREVDDKLNIVDADLKRYYEEHISDYVEPEKVVVTEITLKEEEKAKEIIESIKNGADFTELAKELDAKGESFGPGQGNEGKTSPFSRDSYSAAQEFVNTAFSLEVGQISDIITQPIREETYYMIIRLDEKIPSRQKEFSEVEKSIRRTVEKEKKKARMDAWLGTLKEQKNFNLYTDKIPEVTQESEETEPMEEQEEEQEAPEESSEETQPVEEEK